MASDDILLPGSDDTRPPFNRAAIVAFVPIMLALIGVAAVFLGGVSARSGDPPAVAAAATVDPVTTGSIAAPDAIGDWLASPDQDAVR